MRPVKPAEALADVPVVPKPVSVTSDPGAAFTLDAATKIVVSPTAENVGKQLAGMLRPATAFALQVVTGDGAGASDAITLSLGATDATLGPEGYELSVTPSGITIEARAPAGLFHGTQTLRQLLPPSIESREPSAGPWVVPGGRIIDYPRYAWRGAMLDVARHFQSVATVERYIDDIARYKINTLHLHLSDDQGWRIQIDSWPRLTQVGGSTQVGGGQGGFYTKAQYRQIVEYAAARYITIVPEIDMPGHVNAALASYGELACDDKAPPLYTGIRVGFSSLCVGKPVVRTFLDDVIGELAAMTPGPYIHIGGDEASATSDADYVAFVTMAQQIVEAHGKKMIGWAEVSRAPLHQQSLAQYWAPGDRRCALRAAVAEGVQIIASPADHAYLDQKYNAGTRLGTNWAGPVSVRQAYEWDPAALGAPAASIIGVEAPLWSETLTKLSDIEYMAFPRLAGIAEIGWSPKNARDWSTYRIRLGAQGPRWHAAGINFYASPEVPWQH